MKYNKGDKVDITMEGFMGMEFPATVTISNICYEVTTDTGNGCYATMTLTEDELEKRLLNK